MKTSLQSGLAASFLFESGNNVQANLPNNNINKGRWAEDSMVVVDEVSMLSAQFLVLLDTRLRSMYKPDQTFGGISVLLIGDFI